MQRRRSRSASDIEDEDGYVPYVSVKERKKQEVSEILSINCRSFAVCFIDVKVAELS